MKKNNTTGIIIGLIFLVIGGGYLAEVFGLIDEFTIFFKGWWSLFIIVPCFCGLFRKDGAKVGNLIGMAIGLLLLLMAQGVLSGEKFWALLLATVCVLIGVNLMLPKRTGKTAEARPVADRFDRSEYVTVAEVVEEPVHEETVDSFVDSEDSFKKDGGSFDETGKMVYSAVFSGRDIRVDHSEFNGADLSAVFGGIDLNLKNAIIRKNVTIDVKAVFGGIDILMPEGVRVVVDVTPILGGVENGTRTPLGADESTPTVFVRGTCVFGGLEIK